MKPLPCRTFALILGASLCAPFLTSSAFAQAAETEVRDAPQSVRAIAPVYPYDLLLQGKTGWAEIRFTVEPSGKAIFASVTGSSDPAFAKALLADIEANEFMAPRVNGKPKMTASKLRHAFNGEASLDPLAKTILAELRKPKPAIVAADQLDKKPAPLRQDPPPYPFSLMSDGLSGRAEIEVVIDRNGRPLFPRIVSASHEDFGWSAAIAVNRLRFPPPTKDGKPVEARVVVPVVFDHSKVASSW
jgi:TonB family protein